MTRKLSYPQDFFDMCKFSITLSVSNSVGRDSVKDTMGFPRITSELSSGSKNQDRPA